MPVYLRLDPLVVQAVPWALRVAIFDPRFSKFFNYLVIAPLNSNNFKFANLLYNLAPFYLVFLH